MRIKVLIIFILLLIPVLCSAQKFSVKVIGISDGDTFTGINRDNLQIKFRIYGIDAPEKKQAYGTKSKEKLSSLIFGKSVTVNVQSQDSWGRYIAYVFTADGEDISLLMLQSGMAWHYKKYDNSEVYSSAERNAKFGERGLWADSSPLEPWRFRSESKQ